MQHMRIEQLTRLAVAVAVLAVITAVLLLGTRIISGFGLLTLPVSWPGFIILGADEMQERYGYCGELLLFWLFSLPCIVVYAWLYCLWRERRSGQDIQVIVNCNVSGGSSPSLTSPR